MAGKLQQAALNSSSVSSGVAFKNVKKSKSKSNIRGINSDSSRGHQHDQQSFPLDFTFSKNHWTSAGE